MESGPGGSAFEICFVTSRMAGKPSFCFGHVGKGKKKKKQHKTFDEGVREIGWTWENCKMRAMTFRQNYF